VNHLTIARPFVKQVTGDLQFSSAKKKKTKTNYSHRPQLRPQCLRRCSAFSRKKFRDGQISGGSKKNRRSGHLKKKWSLGPRDQLTAEAES
jgi:hypothetical protein